MSREVCLVYELAQSAPLYKLLVNVQRATV